LKKYLIVITGSPRGGNKTWESMIENVKKPLNADLALCYGSQFKLPKYLEVNVDYDWPFEEPDNWRDYYSKNFNGSWEKFLMLGSDRGMAGGIDNNSGSGAIVSGLKDVVLNNYSDILQKYEYIIHTRFDQFYVDTHPEYEGEDIWIPEGENYYGVCDRHAIFPSKYINEYFGVCKFIDNKEVFNNPPQVVNPESVFLNNLIFNNLEKKIVRIPRFQFTSSSKTDTTRWRKAIFKIYFFNDLLIKYPDEFIDSVYNFYSKNGLFNTITKIPILFFNYIYLVTRRKIGSIKSKLINDNSK